MSTGFPCSYSMLGGGRLSGLPEDPVWVSPAAAAQSEAEVPVSVRPRHRNRAYSETSATSFGSSEDEFAHTAQVNSRGFSDFCVADVLMAENGRSDIEAAQIGKALFPLQIAAPLLPIW